MNAAYFRGLRMPFKFHPRFAHLDAMLHWRFGVVHTVFSTTKRDLFLPRETSPAAKVRIASTWTCWHRMWSPSCKKGGWRKRVSWMLSWVCETKTIYHIIAYHTWNILYNVQYIIYHVWYIMLCILCMTYIMILCTKHCVLHVVYCTLYMVYIYTRCYILHMCWYIMSVDLNFPSMAV